MGLSSKTLICISIVYSCAVILANQTPPPPKKSLLILSETKKEGDEGAMLQVSCTAHVPTKPDSLKWINPKSGHGDSNIQLSWPNSTTVTMTIQTLRLTDAGAYTCVLQMDNGGEETAKFSLFIKHRASEVKKCLVSQFRCKKSQDCIFMRYRCDGRDDCGDGSDEECEPDPCIDKFRCNNTRCVNKTLLCDHVDNCGDLSDEGVACHETTTETTHLPLMEDNHFGWFKITVSAVIASTVGLVILISFVVIMVFRIKMKRLRELRIARAFERIYQNGGPSEATSSGQCGPSDQHPFLPSSSQAHFGHIIVNVNNGVQYIPGYDYSLFMATPPPYTEAGDGENPILPPPPYSTLDRARHAEEQQAARETTLQLSETSGQNCVAGSHSGDTGVSTAGRGSSSVKSLKISPGCEATAQFSEQLDSGSGTLPGISINAMFVQSLLGPHLSGSTTLESTSQRHGRGERSSTHMNSSLDQRINLIHLTSSPKRLILQEPLSSSQSKKKQQCRASLEGQADNPVSNSSHMGEDLVHAPAAPPTEPAVAEINVTEPFLNITSDVRNKQAEDNDTGEQGESCTEDDYDDPWSSSLPLLSSCAMIPFHSAQIEAVDTASACISNDNLMKDVDLPINLNADSGCVASSPELVSPTCLKPDSASNALFNEILRRDEKKKPKAGHLSVQKGHIMLHTPKGVLVSNEPAPNITSSSPAACRLSGELVVKDGTIMLQMPTQAHSLDRSLLPRNVNKLSREAKLAKGSFHNTHDQRAISTSALAIGNGLPGQIRQSSSNPPSTDANPSPAKGVLEMGSSSSIDSQRKLNVKDGCLVLEAPRCTPSLQILTQLQGVYAAEERKQKGQPEECVEPVVNTKRVATSVVSRPPLPKFNSDIVSPVKYQQL